MRTTALAVVLLLIAAGSAAAQSIYTPGYYGALGPWQPSRVYPGYHYYNYTAPVYPIAAPIYGRSRYGGYDNYDFDAYLQRETTNSELRRIRNSIEDANADRRWRR